MVVPYVWNDISLTSTEYQYKRTPNAVSRQFFLVSFTPPPMAVLLEVFYDGSRDTEISSKY